MEGSRNFSRPLSDLPKEIKESRYRYLIIILYIFTSCLTATINYTFSPITHILTGIYGASYFQIYYISICFSAAYLIFSLPSSYIVEKKGVKYAIVFNALLLTIGSGLRCFINENFLYVILGQTIAAISAPGMQNCVTKISFLWFSSKRRVLSTAFMTSAYMLGTSLAFFLAKLNVNLDSNLVEEAERRGEIQKLMQVVFFLTIPNLILNILLFKNEPSTPTSFLSNHPRDSFQLSLKFLCVNKNYIFLFLAFSLLLGNYIVILTFIHFILSPFGVSQDDISMIGGVINISCFFGKILVGCSPTRKIGFKNIFIGINFAILTLMIFFYAILNINSIILSLIISGILGLFLQMYWAPALEFACELTFPVPEANSSGVLLIGGCIYAILAGVGFSSFYNFTNKEMWGSISMVALIVIYTISALFFLLIKEETIRSQLEQNANDSKSNGQSSVELTDNSFENKN